MALLVVGSLGLLRGGESVVVVDGQDVQCLLPVADFAGHVLAVLPAGCGDEVEHLQRGLLVGEMASSPPDGPNHRPRTPRVRRRGSAAATPTISSPSSTDTALIALLI